MIKRKQIVVVAATIQCEEKLLIVQRSLDPNDLQPGLWEFPGGKVEFGETPENALKREICEELEMVIYDLKLFDATSGIFERKGQEIHAVMLAYNCNSKSKDIKLNTGNDFRWISTNELKDYNFAKLDIPIIAKLLRK